MNVAALKKPVEVTPALYPHHGNHAQALRNIWRYEPEPNHTKEHALSPEYYAHVSQRHRVGDKIELRWQDGSRYAELLVIACDRNYTKVRVISWLELNEGAEIKSDRFDIQWRGPAKKHCIVRRSDGETIHEGEQTKADAKKWLDDNLGTLT